VVLRFQLSHTRAFPAIAVGGFIVGVVDLASAIVVYSPRKPILIPQTIASGILGLKSYSGGTQTAALGVVLHFVMALGAATGYYLASRKLTFLAGRAVLCGLIYGALVYLFMHIVMLRLSAAPEGTSHSSTWRPSSSSTGSASGCPSRSRCVTIRNEFSIVGWPTSLTTPSLTDAGWTGGPGQSLDFPVVAPPVSFQVDVGIMRTITLIQIVPRGTIVHFFSRLLPSPGRLSSRLQRHCKIRCSPGWILSTGEHPGARLRLVAIIWLQ
jgi:uncharacterized membrane protein YagU involved in acid resistance